MAPTAETDLWHRPSSGPSPDANVRRNAGRSSLHTAAHAKRGRVRESVSVPLRNHKRPRIWSKVSRKIDQPTQLEHKAFVTPPQAASTIRFLAQL